MATIPDEITNEAELESAVEAVGNGLQLISNYLADNPDAVGKVRFPRGFLGTAYSHSKKFGWIENDILKRNMSYQYIFYDVLRWVSNRTDIGATAREMLYKHAIVVVASVAEGLVDAAAKQLEFVERKFPKQLNRLLKEKVISQKIHDEVVWMWGVRQRVHVHIVDDLEWSKYKVTDARRASKAVAELERTLDIHFDFFAS
jgi:hypothetical protein